MVGSENLSYITSAMEKWSKSILNLTLPSDLVNKSSIKEIIDESDLIIKCLFLYGVRKGKMDYIPYDGGGVKHRISDLSTESLWIYGKANIPKGFDTSIGLLSPKRKPFYIGTGKTRKCPSCKGRGLVMCTNCKGRGRYQTYSGGNRVWRDCSCGDGYIDCKSCSGYGTIQEAIKCSTSFQTYSDSVLLYDGPGFDDKSSQKTSEMIKNSNGTLLLKEIVEYPFEKMCSIIKGGVDVAEYLNFQKKIKENINNLITENLIGKKRSIQIVYDTLSNLLDKIPNLTQSNKVLEYEAIPIRMSINIERIPVFKVNYTYQEKPFIIWVYGDEGYIYASQKPKEMTTKVKVAIVLAGLLLIIGILIFIMNNFAI